MKTKSIIAKIICTCLVTSLLIIPNSVGASTNDDIIKDEQQGVYSQAYTDAEWSKAKLKPVMADKGATKDSTNGIVSIASVGTYPTRNGVILVTPDWYKDLIPTGHAAIIWDTGIVIEAVAAGVVQGPSNWNTSKTGCYGVTVNGTTIDQDNQASNWCRSQQGLPYNKIYLNP